jgi:hypothetical protein
MLFFLTLAVIILLFCAVIFRKRKEKFKFMPNIILQGIPFMVMEGKRIPQKERDIKKFIYLELRHADNDWSKIISVENNVVCNFYGTLIMEFGSMSRIYIKTDGKFDFKLNELKRMSYERE